MPIKDFQNVAHKIISPLITPDTQRDAVRIDTTIAEGHNHCKNTSVTMMLNWIGQNYESAKTLAHTGEYSYNASLLGYMQPGEKIQDWPPHVKCINGMLANGKIPLQAHFVNFRANYTEVLYSLLCGYPVVLGTMITTSGHIVLLVGLTANGDFIIIDPYGEAPNYKNHVADYYVIPKHLFNHWIDTSCNCIYLKDFIK
ncbi:MAG: C39 family peptidase [Leptospiraceae bacterium]|nr:C39 family peptidase [Leptospiraceae bacterium]